jgi:hypothetical protein
MSHSRGKAAVDARLVASHEFLFEADSLHHRSFYSWFVVVRMALKGSVVIVFDYVNG